MVPAFNVGHVTPQLRRTAVSIGIETKPLTGSGKLCEIKRIAIVAGMCNAMSKEWIAMRVHQPISTINCGKTDGF